MIKAKFHSDDYRVEIDFDATLFFEKASDGQIIALIECGWCNDFPADEVMYVMDMAGSEVFAPWGRYQEFYDGGFEISVDADDAINWLSVNKPHLYIES